MKNVNVFEENGADINTENTDHSLSITCLQGNLQVEIVIKSLETRQQRYNSLVFATGPAVADAGKLRRLSCSEDDFIYFLPVAATSLRARFQVYLSKLWVVDVTKEVRYDLSIYCLLSDIILSSLLVSATSLRAGFQVYLS